MRVNKNNTKDVSNIIAMPMKNYLVLSAGLLWTSGVYAGPIIPVIPWSLSCPISTTYTVNSTGAYNSGSCTITTSGTLDVSMSGAVTNSGGMINDGSILNSGVFTNTGTGSITGSGVLTNNGTLVNQSGGLIDGKFDNRVGGSITNEAGGRMQVTSSSYNNGGTITNHGIVAGFLNNSGGSFINKATIDDLGITNKGGVINEGTWTATKSISNTTSSSSFANAAGGTFTLVGNIANEGIVSNSGLFNIASGGSIYGNGEIRNQSGGVLNNAGGISASYGDLVNSVGATLNNSGRIAARYPNVMYNYGTLTNTGVLETNLRFGSGVAIINSGELNNAAGGQVLLTLGDLDNKGTFNNAGTLTNHGTLTNRVGGTLTNDGKGLLQNTGSLRNESLITNRGELANHGTVQNLDRIVNDGWIRNTGSFEIASAASVTGKGTFSQYGGGSTLVNGTLAQAMTTLESGGLLHGAGTVAGALLNQGTIRGEKAGITLTGAVSGAGNYEGTVTFTGSFGPGNSPALVTGDHLIFGAGNLLTMELGGLARGTEYDAIDANWIDLGGTLALDLLDLGSGLFNPHAGDYFDILIASDLTNDFGTFDFSSAALDSGLYWTHSIFALGDGREAYRLMVAGSTGGGGDTGGGAGGGGASGGDTGSGGVGGGTDGGGTGSGGGTGGTVPEPGTLLLVMLGLLAMGWQARRQGCVTIH